MHDCMRDNEKKIQHLYPSVEIGNAAVHVMGETDSFGPIIQSSILAFSFLF